MPSRDEGGKTATVTDLPDHTAAPGMWSYACRCLKCRWEQWWNEGDNSVIGMPSEPHPDGDFVGYFNAGDFWRFEDHPNESGEAPRG